MDIVKVKNALKVLNGDDPTNDAGNCEQMAVAAANALISGIEPGGLCPQDTPYSSEAAQLRQIQPFIYEPDIGPTARDSVTRPGHTYDHFHRSGGSRAYLRNKHTRAFLVWSWLKNQARRGVYVFAQDEDHVYDFVVDGDLYLIDSTTQIYKKVNTPGDCSVISVPYSPGFKTRTRGNERTESNTNYGFNYLSPQPLDFEDNLKVYYWGRLHTHWN